MSPALRIQSPGLLSSVQDLGRTGHQRLGVGVAGALDAVSLRAANLLVGNKPDEGALEALYAGPSCTVEADSVRLACVGAEVAIDIVPVGNSRARRIRPGESFVARRGETVRIGALTESAVLYLAVEGGFDLTPLLDSVATDLRAGVGGYLGRALRAGDALPLCQDNTSARGEARFDRLDLSRPKRFRVVLGPQHDLFTETAVATLLSGRYVVKPDSGRMGMRLDGPRLTRHDDRPVISEGIAPGTIQVAGSGAPIVLLADRGSTGGYPKIATIISADLPALGRSRIGESIGFEAVSVAEAVALRRALMREIEGLPARLVPARSATPDLAALLLEANLISGAVDAVAAFESVP